MTRYGYFLSSEEYDPAELVRQARLAEQAGFQALWISDHFHPWLDEQGQSGFVWSVIGAISQATSLPVTTAVTCPIMRMHPALVAQAAATSAVLTDGRFNLGVGSGEALNEHIVGQRWPGAEERLDMLEEAVGLIRELFTGRLVNHRGQYFTAETARLYSVPAESPPIYMSGFGEQSVQLAAQIADGYMTVSPDADMVRLYRDSGGRGPVQGGLKVCWGPDADQARGTMHRLWPNEQIPGEAAQLLPLPRHYEQLSQLVSKDMIAAPCGPDPEVHLAALRPFDEAGFDEVFVGQVGGAPEAFFEFFAGQVLPRAGQS
ncbi:MAG: TIGR03557 family F420-dependent LLM class oxidoreductase [Actinobacteria bacterium]|nr:TIGR03557 family F420-dependent LLM class oxidoreductase [Actinomycetota bacterium]